MSSTRRTFLQNLAAAGVVSIGALPPRFLCRAALAADEAPAPTKGRILVLIELEGGNDGLNTVIPYGDADYYKARPAVGIARDSVLRINEHIGLHPALAGFKELYDEGRLAILQGVGYANPDRSHFSSMDIWHSARLNGKATDGGWIGRALDRVSQQRQSSQPALALGVERLPMALIASKVNVPAISDLADYQLQLGGGSERLRAARRELLVKLAERPPHGAGEIDFIQQTARAAYHSAEKLRSVLGAYKPAATYPPNGLGGKLKLIAQMIAGDLGTQIFFVSLGGFDTHADQPAAHTALLTELSSAVRAFYLDLKGHGLDQRVALATFSEFGRRVKENGSLGTDHGAASQMFVVTPVKGGVFGKHPSLTDLDDGDLKFHTDFRVPYATLLERWLDLPSEAVLGQAFDKLDFV
jgi:uncharacterized protein (DUF1501 family)